MIILYIHIFGFFRNELFSSYLLGVQNDVEKITFISLGTVDDGSCKYFCGSVPLISWEESRECTIRCWIKLPKQPSRFFQLVLFGGNWEMDIFILFKKLYNVKNNYFNWKTLFVFILQTFESPNIQLPNWETKKTFLCNKNSKKWKTFVR